MLFVVVVVVEVVVVVVVESWSIRGRMLSKRAYLRDMPV